MLVLNTNEQLQGDVLSNRFLWDYPDFRSILFYPVKWADYEDYWTFSIYNWEKKVDFINNAEAFSVNWTKVNIANQVIDEKMLLTWTQNWANFWDILKIILRWHYCTFNRLSSDTSFDWRWIIATRFWFSQQLQGSWIVWKRITTNLWFSFYNAMNTSSYSLSWWTLKFWLLFRLWLLHSDWSITYWERLTNDSLISPNRPATTDNTVRYRWSATRLVELSSDWLNYVEWDRLIIEVWAWKNYHREWTPASASIGDPNNYYCHIYFWRKWSIDDNETDWNSWSTTNINWTSYLWSGSFRWRPIQISIE